MPWLLKYIVLVFLLSSKARPVVFPQLNCAHDAGINATLSGGGAATSSLSALSTALGISSPSLIVSGNATEAPKTTLISSIGGHIITPNIPHIEHTGTSTSVSFSTSQSLTDLGQRSSPSQISSPSVYTPTAYQEHSKSSSLSDNTGSTTTPPFISFEIPSSFPEYGTSQAQSQPSSPSGSGIGAVIGSLLPEITAYIPNPLSTLPPTPAITVGSAIIAVSLLKSPDLVSEGGTINPGFAIGTQVVSIGQTIDIAGVSVAILTSSDQTQIVVGANTIPFPANSQPTQVLQLAQLPPLTVGTQILLPNSAGLYILGTQTLAPNGAPLTLGNSPSATTLSLQANSDTTFLLINGAASIIPASNPSPVPASIVPNIEPTITPAPLALTLNGKIYTYTFNLTVSGYIIAPGTTLTPGDVVTIDHTPVSLALGATQAVVGGVTEMLVPPQTTEPAVLTLNGHSYTFDSSADGYMLGPGTTLKPGGVVTINQTAVSLAHGASLAVVGGSTETLIPAATASGVSASGSQISGEGITTTGQRSGNPSKTAAVASSSSAGAVAVKAPSQKSRVDAWLGGLASGFGLAVGILGGVL